MLDSVDDAWRRLIFGSIPVWYVSSPLCNAYRAEISLKDADYGHCLSMALASEAPCRSMKLFICWNVWIRRMHSVYNFDAIETWKGSYRLPKLRYDWLHAKWQYNNTPSARLFASAISFTCSPRCAVRLDSFHCLQQCLLRNRTL